MIVGVNLFYCLIIQTLTWCVVVKSCENRDLKLFFHLNA